MEGRQISDGQWRQIEGFLPGRPDSVARLTLFCAFESDLSSGIASVGSKSASSASRLFAKGETEMDKDEGIRTLVKWFEYRPFRVREISDGRLREISKLIGADTRTNEGRRILLGKELTQMNGYECVSSPNLGATLTVVEFAEGSKAAVFQIQPVRLMTGCPHSNEDSAPWWTIHGAWGNWATWVVVCNNCYRRPYNRPNSPTFPKRVCFDCGKMENGESEGWRFSERGIIPPWPDRWYCPRHARR